MWGGHVVMYFLGHPIERTQNNTFIACCMKISYPSPENLLKGKRSHHQLGKAYWLKLSIELRRRA
jgi:hypothetical protein